MCNYHARLTAFITWLFNFILLNAPGDVTQWFFDTFGQQGGFGS